MVPEPPCGADAYTIVRLRRELLALRRERAALRARFLPPGRLPTVLSLAPQEAVVVSVLLANDQVSHELMFNAVFADTDPESMPAEKSLDVLICKARKRLSQHRIIIETFNKRGWRIAPLSKARMLNLIREESQATGRPLGAFVAVDLTTHPFQPRPAGRGREVIPRTPSSNQ